MVGGYQVKIKPEHVVYSIMAMPGIIYEISKIIQFILIFMYEIQQVISNIDTFHVQL